MFHKGLIYLKPKFKIVNHITSPTKQFEKVMALQKYVNKQLKYSPLIALF